MVNNNYATLTPSNKRHNDSELSHGHSTKDIKNEFLAHEQSFCSHPVHSGVSEVDNE